MYISRSVLWFLFAVSLLFSWKEFALTGTVLHSMISDPQPHFPYGFLIGTILPFMIPTLFVLGAIIVFEFVNLLTKASR